jgi:hypothetical protein
MTGRLFFSIICSFIEKHLKENATKIEAKKLEK